MSKVGARANTAQVDGRTEGASGQNPKDAFYGWVVLFVSTLGLAFGGTTLPVYTLGVFVRPLSAEFHWTVPQIVFVNLIFIHATVLLAPVGGWVVDRANARFTISLSAGCFGTVLASLYFLPGSLPAFYTIFVVMAVAGCCTTPVAFAKLISRWFDRQRGLALGVAMSGVGIGGVILPLIANALIDDYGWRTAYLWLGLGVMIIDAPLLAFLVRSHPADLEIRLPRKVGGQVAVDTPKARAEAGFGLRQALRGRVFWTLFIAFGLLGFGFGSLLVPLASILIHHGLTSGNAALALAVLGFANIAGRIFVGLLMDRVYPVWLGLAVWIPAGLAIMLLGRSGLQFWVIYAVSAVLGLALGSEIDVLAYLAGRHFGLRAFGRIYAILFSFYTICSAWGALLVSQLIQTDQGYASAMMLLAAGVAIGCLVLLTAPRYPSEAGYDAPIREILKTHV